jgi:hypothetical protein
MGIESFVCRRRIIGRLSRRFLAITSEARARVLKMGRIHEGMILPR